MKNSPERELLNDVLAVPDFRAASLQHTLGTLAHERRRRKRAAIGVGAVALVALLLIVRSERPNGMPAPRNNAELRIAQKVPGTSIQIIGDEELFALFQGRSVALIGPPDHRQLIFLDEK